MVIELVIEMVKQAHFCESMAGTWRRSAGAGSGDSGGRIGFEITVDTINGIDLFGSVVGEINGTFSADGLATSVPTTGTIEISPVENRQVRYKLDFVGDDAKQYRFDGWKSIRWTRPLSTWTTLPGSIYDEAGEIIGTATLRFDMRNLPAMLGSMRLGVDSGDLRLDGCQIAGASGGDVEGDGRSLERRHVSSRSGRLEVWYDTFSDEKTGMGFWIHHELITPSNGAEPYGHGWIAVFSREDESPPLWKRFGPFSLGDGEFFEAGDVVAEPGRRIGSAGKGGEEEIRWELTYEDSSKPLYTFTKSAWEKQLLPSCQVVPSPQARFSGTISVGRKRIELDAARGAAARIYGKANAKKWAWLHADLGGGDVLEIVAAAPRHGPLGHLHVPPIAFVQLRFDGSDWPRNSIAAAPLFKARIDMARESQLGPKEWSLEGRVGNKKLSAWVTLPEGKTVSIGYVDPDGERACCVNSEVANAHVVLKERTGGIWRIEKEWRLTGSAHAEIGLRS